MIQAEGRQAVLEARAGPVRAAQILGTQAGAREPCRVPEGMLGSSLMSPLSPLSHWATARGHNFYGRLCPLAQGLAGRCPLPEASMLP